MRQQRIYHWRTGLEYRWWTRVNWGMIAVAIFTLAFWGMVTAVILAWFFDMKPWW